MDLEDEYSILTLEEAKRSADKSRQTTVLSATYGIVGWVVQTVSSDALGGCKNKTWPAVQQQDHRVVTHGPGKIVDLGW